MTSQPIHRVTRLELKVGSFRWPFADERRAEISAHFAEKQREKPKLWNGRVLLARNPVIADGCFAADYFETDFASFLAWRDWGCPDKAVFNGFGMGALRSSDGAFALGEMGGHTANAGRIYFPAGTPDLGDIKDGSFDVSGSVVREAEEETGLTPSDYRAGEDWDCIDAGTSIALIRRVAGRHAGRSVARQNRGQSRPPDLARTVGDPSGAQAQRHVSGDAALCHGLG